MATKKSDTAIEIAGDYNMDEVLLVNHEGDKTDIKRMIVEFNIYESIYKNAVTGTLVIADAQNMIAKIPIQGTERLEFKLSTPGTRKLAHTVDASEETGHPFYIYKLTNKKQVSEGTMSYVLHFGSREFMRNLRVKVSQAYNGTMDDIVAQIFADKSYLDSRKRLLFEPTRNSDKVLIPNMRPFAAIDMISKKALAKNSKGAGYYFYETTKGFHFRSWESMCVDARGNPRTPKQEFQYMPMNITDPNLDDLTKIEHDYRSVEKYKFINNFHDVLDNQAAGTYAHRVIAYNIYSKSYKVDDFHYHDYYAETKHTDGPNPAIVDTPVDFDDKGVSDYPESKTTVMATTQFLHDEDTGAYGIPVESDGITDASRISQQMQVASGTRLKLTIKGQSYLEPGDVIKFNIQAVERKSDSDGKQDAQFAGRYVITKIRHRVTNDEYVQVLECAKDSVFKPYTTYSSKTFTGARLPREKGQAIDIMAKANPHG